MAKTWHKEYRAKLTVGQILNLVLSCLAAIQAPIILMSQNRQEDRDRHQVIASLPDGKRDR